MLARCVQQVARRAGLRMASNCPWKMMDYYYKYDFTPKMEFIDHTVRFPLFRVMDLEGKVLAPEYDTLGKEELLKALNIMASSREMDNVYNTAQRQNRISFYMTCMYEEAANVGPALALKPEDPLFLQYREFPMLMMRGYSMLDILHNLKGSKKDTTLGKCFPLMNCDPSRHIASTSAPLGNRNPHSAGAGYYYRVKGMDRVAACVFGEGSASEGDAYVSMNFAAVLGSQTLFYCRNNVYAISVFREDQYAGDGVAPRGIGLGIPAIKVDGLDLLAVYHATKKAREMIMARKGPVIVEAYTYRGGDHSTSDSADSYRNPQKMGPVNEYLKSLGDPLIRLSKLMERKGYIANAEKAVAEIRQKAREECLANLKIVDQTKFAHYDTMFEGVYKEEAWNVKEQREEMHEHLKKYADQYPLHEFPK